MKISYNWLQTFFDTPLPTPEKLGERITFGAFEIEEITPVGDDTLLDIKVLPDRAPDAFSHRGIAHEISILCGIPMNDDPFRELLPELTPLAPGLTVAVEDSKRSSFYGAALVRGVAVGPSPDWLVQRLTTIGQRSINNVVDATNYVMFHLGSPLHAFDAKKLTDKSGMSIIVRAAKQDEKITALGGLEYTLTDEMSVIADAHSGVALAIAGIKGGTVAEVDSGTTDIVIECALFDAVRTRRTSQALRLRTDASHRFENGIANALPSYGLTATVKLITEIAGGELIGYAETGIPAQYEFKLGVSVDEVNRRLGTNLSLGGIEDILKKLDMKPSLTDPIEYVVSEAPKYVGVPYKHGASVLRDSPRAFDCSSFTAWLFAQAGIALPRISVDQYVWGEIIKESDLQPGDIIFANSGVDHIWTESQEFVPGTPVPEGVDHLGIYLGGGKVIHATRDEGGVVIHDLASAPRFSGKTVGYRRFAKKGEKRLVITVPFERLDIRQGADLIEEIGRVYGYEHIGATSLSKAVHPAVINKNVYWMEVVRGALDAAGFTEVFTYSLRAEGTLALTNALASDKSHLREDLKSGIGESLDKNEYYLPLTGQKELKLYEIGHVFTIEGEGIHVALGARASVGRGRGERTKALLEEGQRAVIDALGIEEGTLHGTDHEDVFEFDLSKLIEQRTPASSQYPPNPLVSSGTVYTPLSAYPFILRDISMWIPDTDEARGVVLQIFGENSNGLLKHVDLFDQFTKDGRNSLAFHLVFQSDERTLTEQDVNEPMERITKALTARGWEIR